MSDNLGFSVIDITIQRSDMRSLILQDLSIIVILALLYNKFDSLKTLIHKAFIVMVLTFIICWLILLGQPRPQGIPNWGQKHCLWEVDL